MATLKEVYDLLKQKQEEGEDIGMFGESYLSEWLKLKVTLKKFMSRMWKRRRTTNL